MMMTKTKQNFQHLNQKLLGIQKHIRTLRILTNITKLRKRIKQSSQQILSEIRSLEIWNPSQKVRVIRSQWQRNMKNCIQRISPRLCQQWIWNQWKTRIQRIERKSCLSARCSINETWRWQGFLDDKSWSMYGDDKDFPILTLLCISMSLSFQ